MGRMLAELVLRETVLEYVAGRPFATQGLIDAYLVYLYKEDNLAKKREMIDLVRRSFLIDKLKKIDTDVRSAIDCAERVAIPFPRATERAQAGKRLYDEVLELWRIPYRNHDALHQSINEVLQALEHQRP